MNTQPIAVKFVHWDVCSLDALKNSRVYNLRERLNNGEKMSREDKNWLAENLRSNAYFRIVYFHNLFVIANKIIYIYKIIFYKYNSFMEKFDEKTVQGLCCYVYLLIDPVKRIPFYVGKGSGNRLYDHVNYCIKEEHEESLKYDEIRKIGCNKVIYMILRHGLTDKEALHIEAATIDLLGYLKPPLTNIAGGYNSIEKGLMSTEEIKRIYNAVPLDSIAENCMIININKSYIRGGDKDAIFNATKGVWAMDINRAQSKEYVLSVYKGLIVEVFHVNEWIKEKRYYSPSANQHGNKKRAGCSFKGEVAEKSIRDKYINKSIAHKHKKGASNPIQYSL